jgi:hypothetical protein
VLDYQLADFSDLELGQFDVSREDEFLVDLALLEDDGDDAAQVTHRLRLNLDIFVRAE